ncbi:MAG: FtsQ-type POTRA domain-containing protein, partial [Rhodoferax sp.]|nr:FtsQ-type POTRA domain-containing protein [Rhodoferax sp.]
MNQALAPPVDVKLMNMTTALLMLTFATLSVLAGARWLARLPLFDIRSISVRGDVVHSNVMTLRANVLPRLSGTFFSVDLARVRAAFEGVPWVRRAVVRRDFPNRLLVDLQEHQAVAYWGPEGELRLINNFGEVFDANVGEIEQDSLPRLHGPEGQS